MTRGLAYYHIHITQHVAQIGSIVSNAVVVASVVSVVSGVTILLVAVIIG